MKEIKTYLSYIHPLSDASFEIFINQFKEKAFVKGTYFAKENQFENKFGILLEGVTRAFYRNEEGIEYNKTFTVPISFLGAYSSLVSGIKNQINIQALTDCKMLVGDYREFAKLYDEYPEIERLSRKLSESYFVIKEKREIELVLLDAEQRYQIFKEEFPQLEQLIPQYHIASYLGVTPTQLSRIRKNLSLR